MSVDAAQQRQMKVNEGVIWRKPQPASWCNMTCLFKKQALKKISPRANVETAQNGKEAMCLIAVEKNREMDDEKYTRADIPTHGFDIIIIGGHLIAPCNSNNQNCDKNPFPTSGSQLLHGG
jgi:hypothetical protein